MYVSSEFLFSDMKINISLLFQHEIFICLYTNSFLVSSLEEVKIQFQTVWNPQIDFKQRWATGCEHKIADPYDILVFFNKIVTVYKVLNLLFRLEMHFQ